MENLAPGRLLKTRQGTIAIGVAAAVLAAILLLVYLSHYRSSKRSGRTRTNSTSATPRSSAAKRRRRLTILHRCVRRPIARS